MNLYDVKIIEDSISHNGNRITTWMLTYPRIIHAELLTHRVFSRNSSSSRAIPAKKMISMIEQHPFVPLKFIKTHPGMQGYEYFEGGEEEKVKRIWLESAKSAINYSKELLELKVSKQIINRILEPYSYITVILTATEFDNWFKLRLDKNAEIHIQHLARLMLELYNANPPKLLDMYEWHIPMANVFNSNQLVTLPDLEFIKYLPPNMTNETLIKLFVSTARCARTSYLNFLGKDDYESDINLFMSLYNDCHMSPFEHCALNVESDKFFNNFKGYYQLRRFIERKETIIS